ncbi:hypothetical protein CERSUDRAFT_105660 [Gelatoporia subvermispora B]|uniref:Uncharacterized protein n=1 Tax=Ceriporiopsis subvermispora (strain B) TaxID=914234 RepID=M2RGZ3_CERS8|nr:hypothetical protein CERSUDRAFT_105660 [Gelatoporia subvermispora B]
MSEVRCRRLQSFHQYYAMLTQSVIAAILLIRTYALYNRSRRILVLLVATAVVAGSVSVWSILSERNFTFNAETAMHLPSCDLSISNQQGRRLTGAWSSMLVFDTLVFILTVLRAVQSNGLWRGGLLRLMVLDGAAYYGLMVMANIANIVTFVVPVPTAKGMCVSLTNVISSTLISRIMLNIRDPARRVLTEGHIPLGKITLDTLATECTHTVSEDFEDVMIIA